MKRVFLLVILFSQIIDAQNISQKLDAATKNLLASPGMYAANLSFYVADDKGTLVYEYQGNKGLSTASTQKIFTAAAALELLGNDYKYKTQVLYSGRLDANRLLGDLIIVSNGDPTLGSWRYEGYKPEDFKQKLINSIKSKGISQIDGDLVIDDAYFDFQYIPGGWPWNDMGNYYGAGVWGVNWRENQFDIHINGGSAIGSPTKFKGFSYDIVGVKWLNETTSARKDTGDRSIIYTAPHSGVASINGTLPMGKTSTVSGSVPNPPLQLGVEVVQWLKENGIDFKGKIMTASQQLIEGNRLSFPKAQSILEYQSPTMDKIVYWFMRKSVNLYGETLIKTLGKEKGNNASFESGISILKDFWKNKGIHSAMINFADGSGLSPQNYASAKAEVQALLWAAKQPWYTTYWESFPTYNNMRMKSGTIKDSKAYAGYHTSKEGKKYVYAIMVNNYSGGDVNGELFRVLNILK